MSVHAALVRLSLAVLALCVAFPPFADAATRKPAKLSVMTRNIYLGGDISKPIGTSTPAEFSHKNTEVWQNVQKTDFPARAKVLANEIRKTKPDVIGLQEVALWRKSPDGTVDGQQTASTIVVYDFLKLLQGELKARKLSYRVGMSQREADVEGPTDLNYDVRLTMRDVTLVKKRKGLKIRKKGGKNYKERISVNTAVGPVTVLRGYNYVDLSNSGRKLRFVDTHLEAFLDGPREKQARELVAKGGPTRTKQPVILVGDMNSDPNNAAGANPAAYNVIRKAGFRDAWIAIKGKSNKGYACCMKREDILDPPPAPFDHRIDHIFFKPRKKGDIKGGKTARIVGGDPNNRTPAGLWPSDHGGWVGTFSMK
jgi:endonuclease/exonuclease/phosphatase family metal-dependent hydrolase